MKRRITVRRIIKTASCLLFAIVLAVETSTPAFATNLVDLINRGVDYYIPGDVCQTSGTEIPENSTLPSDVIAKATELKPTYESAARQVDMPWQVLAGIHYRESSFRTNADLQAGNPIGGPYRQDSTSYAKFGYPKTFEESVVIAGKELQDKAKAGIFKKQITTAAINIEVIKDAYFGYNGRADVYKQQAARLGFDPEKQPYEGSPYVMSRYDAVHTDMQIITRDHGGLDGIDKRFGAFAVYALLGGPLTGGGTSGTCAEAGVGVGDLNAIILKYAWPEYRGEGYQTRTGEDTKPKSRYAGAIEAAKKKGEYIGGCQGVDCGAFVMRVMRDSGLDPQYNKYQGVTDLQWKYMRDNPDKYEHLTQVNDSTGTKHLRPGDIAVNGTHTFMHVGSIPGFKGSSASASLCDRAPMADKTYGFSEFEWYRLKTPGNTGNNQPVGP